MEYGRSMQHMNDKIDAIPTSKDEGQKVVRFIEEDQIIQTTT